LNEPNLRQPDKDEAVLQHDFSWRRGWQRGDGLKDRVGFVIHYYASAISIPTRAFASMSY
jgi:hypothetical protein